MRRIQVAIIEDQVAVREGLAHLVQNSEGFSCSGAYGSVRSAISGLEKSLPDIVLIDLGLPDITGVQGIEAIRSRWPSVALLALTVHDENEFIFQALCAGADGYLLKSIASDQLLRSVEEAVDGGAPMSPLIARKVIQLFRKFKPLPKGDYELTPHEFRILNLLANGENYKTSARILKVSVNTISYHVRNIYSKLHVHSKGDAVAKAFRRGLIS